jgi:MerR family transcriptional regulator, copper efflux regulator
VNGAPAMRIGVLARRAGVNVQTVRYYERRGLLAAAARRPSGYREYTDKSLDRLLFIRRAQELGFTLAEIEDLLTLRLKRGTTAADVKARATTTIGRIDEKLQDLQQIRSALAHLAGSCRGEQGPVGDCPLLEVLGPLEPACPSCEA